VRELLTAVLPRPVFDAHAALGIVRSSQQRHQIASLAHRQRTLKRLRQRRRLPPDEKISL